MVKLSEFDQIFALLDQVKSRVGRCVSLESAGSEVLDLLVQKFGESLVLTRMFATVPYGQLPDENREFVQRLAASKAVGDLVHEDTPVLSLIASRGAKPGWNNRRKSAAHLGIPLVSADFVDSIPMVARLLSEVGLQLDWLQPDTGGIDINTLSKMSGVFYVKDAQSALDHRGRKIISAQDFVRENDIHTVFGVAGGFAINQTFLSLLLFCNETIDKPHVAQFLPLISTIKSATVSLLGQGRIFD